ncbi:hypothetical protein GGR57DRAFT_514731 [Xylariaceae sp. FL1272]|nr:hypothetical protein GGR57DRAFT_514731 [Xylariaceae sp. FL1272]
MAQYLSVVHDRSGFERRHVNTEEVEEINCEQMFLLKFLDDLLDQFRQISKEELHGLPLWLCDPGEFFIHRWVDRINHVLRTPDGDEIDGKEGPDATAIGVVWATPSQLL